MTLGEAVILALKILWGTVVSLFILFVFLIGAIRLWDIQVNGLTYECECRSVDTNSTGQ